MMAVLPAHAVTRVGKNIDITASNDPAERQQVEPTIAVDPRNPNIIVSGAQDYRLLSVGGHRWHGFYRSIDDGLTWTVSLYLDSLETTRPRDSRLLCMLSSAHQILF